MKACEMLSGAAFAVVWMGGISLADQEPQAQIELSKNTDQTLRAAWQGEAGRTYFMQWSNDLKTWRYTPHIEFGESPSPCAVDPKGAKKYMMRLVYEDNPSVTSKEEARMADFDGDGLKNHIEVESAGGNPFNSDTDSDGMPDGWEYARGLQVAVPDGTDDLDRDGLNNLGEFTAGTRVEFYDSDGDRFSDGFEVTQAGYDPLTDNAADQDSDGDGMSDLKEISNGTNPGLVDGDGDGISDAVELAACSDPGDPVSRPFDPRSIFGAEIADENAQPIGDLIGTQYAIGAEYEIGVNLEDDLLWFNSLSGVFFTEQEAWRMHVSDGKFVDTDPNAYVVQTEGGGTAYISPYQTYGATLKLAREKCHEIWLEHLGVAGFADSRVTDDPRPDYKHSLSVKASDFLVLTNNANIPPRSFVSQATGMLDYDWRTRRNYLIPLAGTDFSKSFTGGDATGTAYRKISAYGRPMPDAPPEGQAETDVAMEDTFVDAFDLSLHHDTSFASIPLAASDLRLEVTASLRETTWSSRYGLRPEEDLTSPFGICWSSNLCAYIEVVETLGNSTSKPISINVVDEGGRAQRFGTKDMDSFFPWPSTLVDKKTYLNSLVKSGEDLVLKKKFGNKLTYRPCAAWFVYSGDRLDGGPVATRHRYWRLVEVEDRFGVKVVYDYGTSSYSLIPETISAVGRLHQKLSIQRSLNGRRVESISDAEGNQTTFQYANQTFNVPSTTLQYPYQELERVTFPGGVESEHYTYEVVSDQEVNGVATQHMHANLVSIQRDGSDRLEVQYAFDRSRKWYRYSYGDGRIAIVADTTTLPDSIEKRAQDYVNGFNKTRHAYSTMRTQYGVPRRVASIGWPSDGIRSTFAKTLASVTELGPEFKAVSVTEVTDAAGKKCRYTFGGVEGEVIESGSTTSGNSTSVSTDWLIFYKTMTLDYQSPTGEILGSETFEFDPDSGLSLKRMVDFSGNETKWDFKELRPASPRIKLEKHPGFLATWADPSSKTDALGRVESYQYGDHRLLTRSIDVHGTVTDYEVDAKGRRTSMVVTEKTGAVLLKESYEYANPTFPGFMTRKMREVHAASSSGKAWEVDLVIGYVADSHGRLWKEIVDPGGLALTTTHAYDLNNQILSTTDPRSNLTGFVYDARARLTKITNPDLTFREIHYDANGLKSSEIDEKGQVKFYDRDGLGRIRKEVQDLNGDGQISVGDLVTETAYNLVGKVVRVIDPRGFSSVTFYDDLHRPVEVFGGVPAGSATSDLPTLSSLAAASREITHESTSYDIAFNCGGGLLTDFKPTQVVHHHAVVTEKDQVEGPSATTLTDTSTYDDVYRPIRTSVEFQTGEHQITTTAYGLDDSAPADGHETLISSVTDSLGKVVCSTADGLGRVVEVIDGYGLGDPFLINTATTRYSSTGFSWQVIDALGRHTETEYDPAGRAVRVWQPDPETGLITAQSPSSESVYDPNGNVVATIDALGRRSDFDFDSRGRQWRARGPAVTDARNPDAPVMGVRPTQTTEYDQIGNVIAMTDPRGSTTRTFYDRANRQIAKRSNPTDGAPSADLLAPAVHDITSTMQLDAGGLVLSASDGNGNITRNTYDGLGRLVATACDPDDGDPAELSAEGFDAGAYRESGSILVTNRYDDVGHLVEVTDGKGQQTAFTFDGLGRKTAEIRDPGTAAERVDAFFYNALYMSERVDASDRRTVYRHDGQYRVRDIVYGALAGAESSDHPDNRHYGYDKIGRIMSVTYPNDPGSTRETASTYDMLDRLTSETSAGVAHLHSAYDRVGNRLVTTYGRSGTTLVSSYDALNRLQSCEERSQTQAPSGRTTVYAYDLGGLVTRKTLPNGNANTCHYDAVGRTMVIVDRNSRGELTASFDYSQAVGDWPSSYDAEGNLLCCSETYSMIGMVNRVVRNGYDHCDRLLTETITPHAGEPSVTGYGYDAANNRITKAINGVAIDYTFGDGANGANANQLLSYGPRGEGVTHQFSYDANGNRATRSTTAGVEVFAWDAENRLVSIAGPTGTYRYVYDDRTRRVVRDESQTGGGIAELSFCGGTSVQEVNEAGELQVESIRGSDWGGGVGGVLYSIRDGQRSYNAYNSRGDVVSTCDQSGTATWQAAYEAYGTKIEQGVNVERQRANTKDEDPTDLLNEGFRYRDLEAGVFISRDPAGFVDGPNVYTYVKQNPWSGFDPLGLAKDRDENGNWNPNSKLYKVTRNPERPNKPSIEPVISSRDIRIKNAEIWINGMNNDRDAAALLGLNHTGKNEFYMIHNPSNGGPSDLFGECTKNKLRLKTEVVNSAAEILKEFDLNTAKITAHSQGTMILQQAMQKLDASGVDMAGATVQLDGAAAHIPGKYGFGAELKSYGANMLTPRGSPFDAVHNIVGLNTCNPVKITGSLLAAPLLFANQYLSPHSTVEGGFLTQAFQYSRAESNGSKPRMGAVHRRQ